MLERKEIEIELIEDILGTVPKNKDVYKDYILKKAADKNIEVDETGELETVGDLEEKAWTGFHSDGDGIFLYDYMIKGNIKANLETLIQSGTLAKITSYKTTVDRVIFVYPRKIRFLKEGVVKGAPDGMIERPLRVMTAKGPRVSLAKSDIVNAGACLRYEVAILPNPKITWAVIEKCLDYGEYYGLGQWRGSGGYGRYTWKYR